MRFTFPHFPKSYEEFLPLASELMTQPEGTAALLIIALKVYIKDRETGLEMLNHLHGPRPLSAHDKQFIRDRMMDKPYLPDSYAEGAIVDNNYTPDEPFAVNVEHDPIPSYEDDMFRVRLHSSGADSPRLVVLRKKKSGHEWFLWEYPAIVTGIRVPKAEDPWA